MCKTAKDYRAPGAINRLPGEKWADFDKRQREHRTANAVPPPRKKRASRRAAKTRKRIADRFDGLDRDDIGLSAD